MKFGETLATLLTPEWRTQYIEYETLKAQLYQAQEEVPSIEVVGEEVLRRYYARFDENFFVQCEKELTKINTFFSEKLAEAVRKSAALKADLESYKEMSRKQTFTTMADGARKSSKNADKSKEDRRKVSVSFKKWHSLCPRCL